MKTKIIILGAGLVGKPIALDLANDSDFKVTVADINRSKLRAIKQKGIQKIQADLSSSRELRSLVNDFDFIVNAVPGFMGYKCLRNCIEAGKDVVDIAFYPEDVFGLSDLAKVNDVRVISDMGVAPGMSNLLVGAAAENLDHVSNIDIYVGGLPKIRSLPWEYKAVFSPSDIIEEYTRPARLVENGKIVTKAALTEIELLEFDKPGTLEAFNSDGLRSLMFTIKADNMREKTLRYPGYAEKIKLLESIGFFSNKKIDVNGQKLSPLSMTSKLLFEQWKLQENDADFTIMRIVVEGTASGKSMRYTYDLYDEFHPKSGIHSMARTTGYAATMAVRLLVENLHTEAGITVPEFLGKNKKIVQFMLRGLKKRGVVYKTKVEEL
jgi:saccharopine dehydrogenase-like NADP-dependent oxidoreductase